MKIALQLYTIRDCITDKNSLFSALEKVKSIGYEGVEFAGFFGADASELSRKLNELSLTPVCCHVGPDVLADFSDTLIYLNTIGCKACALAWSDTSSVAKLDETCELIKKAKSLAKAAGVELYYHNHDHEFVVTEGIIPLEQIYTCCDLELDTFWSFVAGHNSAEYLKSNNSRIGLVHLKDGTKASRHPCALGEGENDIKSIVKSTQSLGYEWAIVENDAPVPDGLSDVDRSFKYLKALI